MSIQTYQYCLYTDWVLVWKSRCHWAGQTWGDNPSWKTCGRRYQLKSWKESQTLGQSYISKGTRDQISIQSNFKLKHVTVTCPIIQPFETHHVLKKFPNILNSGVNKPLTAVESRENINFFFRFVSSFWYLYMSCFGLFCSVLLIPPYCCVESVQTVHILHHSSIIPHHLLL